MKESAVEWLIGIALFFIGFVIGTQVINLIKNFKKQKQ
jgi:hypothetical protein